ncbi:Flp pilus assembly protein CpaB [Ornithinibacillus californiensis]|uniref:Flp pilus assembly protein CpaB n=1 Tax=Ornithinibacillus californiensis TaxID=161536 RepID=UPI00064D73F5|nr:Flp pilus assembly protein CpaB [Ornithinibacillus californiensis]
MRAKFIFLLAIIMGITTTFLFIRYMDHSQVVETSQPIETVQVVRALSAIPEQTVITDEMLELVEVPDDNIHVQSIHNKEDAIGKFTVDQIEQGEIILTHRIQSQQDEATYVSRKIREGFRAVSVGVNIVQSVTNLIEPGEYVDVIYSYKEKDEDGNEENISELLLTNVRVLAVGRRMISPDDEPYIEYAQVTLEVMPQDTIQVVNAYVDGSLHLTLNPTVYTDEEE